MLMQTKDTGAEIAVSSDVFEYAFNEGLVHQAVVAWMNGCRSGNSAQKTRSEVRGGGRKPWRQKGTGRARAGTIRSPIWRKGGVTFASKKRDYSQKINKKMYSRAICSILAELNRLNRLHLLSDFQVSSAKTKEFQNKMKELSLDNALIIKQDLDINEYLGSRNLHNYSIIDVDSLNPVELLSFDHILITVDALRMIEEKLQ